MKNQNQVGGNGSKNRAVKQGQIVSAHIRKQIEDQGKVETVIVVLLGHAEGLTMPHVALRAEAFRMAYCEPNQRVFCAALATLKGRGMITGKSATGWSITEAGKRIPGVSRPAPSQFPYKPSADIVVDHVLDTLPEILPERINALRAVDNMITTEHPASKRVRDMLLTSERAENPAGYQTKETVDALFKQMEIFEAAIDRANGLLILLGEQVAQGAVDRGATGGEYAQSQALGYIANDVADRLREQTKITWEAVKAMRQLHKGAAAS